ncbi:MarR family winged helix-turn-helix transcriptional regulator [Streptomyces sp. SL13]|uniref:MarR family winged helix-turn-helix transcriptional regulator n=1 Tax=Streptantibioticus silvisoli TaxID=2705255 RepID=A0AA90KF74_9ACTN|nr:MarR family winged helix-turn-helix transcriptional regulator [Streptantibioticus silvisoli]MDI5961263.1 MarR family winged helix-turn-helix transcriptional regulator [Streptantibioticus silvisoli]MDI5968895.1 MarR family winged helix-turn-helix transcriptional regulator [Streptantibioticus silvisoli]
MPAPDLVPGGFSHQATQSASGIIELLHVMGERARESAGTAPASASQLRLMYIVDRDEGIRMRTLCRRLGTAPPSVSRLCDRLQAIGFLERLPSPDSGREVTLRLTTAGRAHLERIREQRESVLQHAIDAMPPAERRALAIGLAGLHGQLSTTADDHGTPGTVSAA